MRYTIPTRVGIVYKYIVFYDKQSNMKEIKQKALSILVSLDNVDDFTKEIATTYLDNNIIDNGGLLWRIYSQHKSFAKHLENIYNSNIENPTIKESLIDEYSAIEELLHCIDLDEKHLCEYCFNVAIKCLETSRMLKDFEKKGYKVSISMTGVYLVHGHLFKTIKEAHNNFFK